MTFDLQKILESKRALRRTLAALPIGEKLRMLDALRERTLTLRRATVPKAACEGQLVPTKAEPGKTKG